MRKPAFKIMLLALTLASLASCNKDNTPIITPSEMTKDFPAILEPTSDQMGVRVTANIPTAVPAPFESNTAGAALVRRLPSAVTTAIGTDTKMVMLKGSYFEANAADLDKNLMRQMTQVYMNGGYVALERPTGYQLLAFTLTLLTNVLEIEADDYEDTFDLEEAEATSIAAQSPQIARIKSRCENIRGITTRGGDDDDEDILGTVWAELIIFSDTDYFMQEPFEEKITALFHSEDAEGGMSDQQAVTVDAPERTPAICGYMADAAAEWLDSVEKANEPSTAKSLLTRAGGSSAINELLDASEAFTFYGKVSFRDWDNDLRASFDRVKMTVRSWGVHDMENNKDYYYVKQNVTLSMAGSYWPLENNYFYTATNYGSYNRWYGTFLSQYDTSLDLSGKGSIHLEAASPNTDNGSSSTSVNIGSSTSHTTTVGLTWGASAGVTGGGPMGSFSVGGSYSEGTTKGTSFSMGLTNTHKDLSVKKNTSGNKVSWTYKGTLPQFYVEYKDGSYWFRHQQAPDILVNDCDVANEACWSVDNPGGSYSVNIESTPQTAALLYIYYKQDGYINPTRKYEYCTTDKASYDHSLLEPNRAMQTWRMNITIDEWEGSPVIGAQGELESNIRTAFPDLYANVFTIADKTPTNLFTINAIVKYTKNIFSNRLDILQSYARSWGIKKFTIHWSCDDLNVKTREGFTVSI